MRRLSIKPYHSSRVSITTTTGFSDAEHASLILAAIASRSTNGAVTKNTRTMSVSFSLSSVSMAWK
ncbi:MAG: hypothetical protein P8181_00235 [bacterium]